MHSLSLSGRKLVGYTRSDLLAGAASIEELPFISYDKPGWRPAPRPSCRDSSTWRHCETQSWNGTRQK